MAQRPIVTIIAVAALLTVGSGRIASATDGIASPQPSGATARPVELGALDGAAVLVRIGAVLDKLDLADDIKAQARQALRAWYVNELANARKRVQAELAGADAARQVPLKQALDDFSMPYRSAQTLRSYAGAKIVLKGVLTAEQLRKLDDLVKTATSDMVVDHYILAVVAGWKKDNVTLTADQQTRLDAIIAAAKAACGILSAGDEVGVRKILNRLSGDLQRVLTPAQRVQVMHPTP